MITLEPIGFVRNSRRTVEDDNWGGIVSEIVLQDEFGAAALEEIEAFSHAEIIFHFHQVDPTKIEKTARHPRNNPHTQTNSATRRGNRANEKLLEWC